MCVYLTAWIPATTLITIARTATRTLEAMTVKNLITQFMSKNSKVIKTYFALTLLNVLVPNDQFTDYL